MIKVALTGQLATAKYLFEAVGLYPPTEQTVARPIETSLAHTLLTRMGLPLTPVACDEEFVPAALTSAAKDAVTETPGRCTARFRKKKAQGGAGPLRRGYRRMKRGSWSSGEGAVTTALSVSPRVGIARERVAGGVCGRC